MTAWDSQRTFDPGLQESFARLSGDWNPLHVDSVAARRMLFGKPAVHGVHLVLWTLDELAQRMPQRFRIHSLSVSFVAPVPLDRVVSCKAQLEGMELTAHLECGDRRTTVLRVTVAPDDSHDELSLPRIEPPPRDAPLETRPEELINARGAFSLQLDPQHTAALFPALAVRIPAMQIAEIIAVTRLVGMRCPGMRSLLSRINLEAHTARTRSPEETDFAYRVQRFDDRFQLARLEVRGPTLGGRVEAFVRPGTVEQGSATALAALVNAREFAGQCALVVGGSRGLGEVCAKLLAAGGADVILTYHLGREDALRVVEDIGAAGGRAIAVPFDVLDPDLDLASVLPESSHPTHVYYFATPFIFEGMRGGFSGERFDGFARYYVHGFSRVFRALQPGLRGVFYPSSSALDELPPAMGEYVAAKAAGEGLCAYLAAANPGIHIVCRRLPRLMTDQTQTLVPTSSAAPAVFLLDELRKLARPVS